METKQTVRSYARDKGLALTRSTVPFAGGGWVGDGT